MSSILLLRCSLRNGARTCNEQASGARFLSSSYVDKLGLGGQKWSRMDPERYKQVIQTSLQEGIRLLEAGQEGGDEALNNALTSLDDDKIPPNIVALTRIGYRTLHIPHHETTMDDDSNNTNTTSKSHITRRWPGDVVVEKQSLDDNDDEVEIVHNITPQYLQEALTKSPLFQNPNICTVPMIHNPEVQINHEKENPQDGLYHKLLQAFQGMEQAVGESTIHAYGVCSNGLSLPLQHPLHLNYEVVLQAAIDAVKRVHGNDTCNDPSLHLLQLPANLLEPNGLHVAQQVSNNTKTWPYLQVVAMRPLTYYPQDYHASPIAFIDYPIPTSFDGKVEFTNEMPGPPPAYQQALQAALSHFDGTELLEKKQSGQALSTLERETLEGCKLLQSILHDLDVDLDKVESFAAHEDNLYKKVIPTLYGTFEELDEESSLVLQQFFAAHGQAVRYAIANKTRALLNNQEDIDINPTTRLQEFALQYVLQQEYISKVVVGCTQPSQVVDNVEIAKKLDENTSSNE